MANKKYIYFLRKSKEREQIEGCKPYLRIILKKGSEENMVCGCVE